MADKTFKRSCQNEPTLRKVEVVPRENEPGSTQGLTPENPEGTKVLGRETPKSFGLGTRKGLGDSKPSFDAFGSRVASTESGGAAELCSEPLLFVVSGSNHCPEGCPGSFRACALRLCDAMASTTGGGVGGDEPDEDRPDKSWVKGDYEPEPSKKKKRRRRRARGTDMKVKGKLRRTSWSPSSEPKRRSQPPSQYLLRPAPNLRQTPKMTGESGEEIEGTESQLKRLKLRKLLQERQW